MVTREGHEVRDSIIKEHQEGRGKKKKDRGMRIMTVRGSLATIVILGDS